MAVELPDAVRECGALLQLGRLQKRYRFRPLLQLMLLPFPLIVTVIALWPGGSMPVPIGFGVVTALLALWAILVRRNRSVYLFDEGLILADSLGRVRHAWHWRDVDSVPGVPVRVDQTIGPVTRRDYSFCHVEPEVSFVVTTLEMPEVHDLAGRVALRVRDARVARLAAGENVGFGVFEVSPATLRHVPAEAAHRPCTPVTVPWSQVTQIGVDGLRLVVVLADGRRLTDLVAAVSDVELFVATVAAIIKSP